MKNSSLLFGVMSGTSLDGIDIVLINQKNKGIKNINFDIINRIGSKRNIVTLLTNSKILFKSFDEVVSK